MEPPDLPATDCSTKADTCGVCSYLLLGLGERGRCPECGAEFGPEIVVVWSLVPKSHRYSTGISITLGALVMAAALTIVCLMGVEGVPLAGYYFAGGAVTAYMGWYLRNGSQVRISGEGHGRRVGYGRVRLMPWAGDEVIGLRRLDAGGYFLAIRRGKICVQNVRTQMSDAEAMRLRDRLILATGRQVEMKLDNRAGGVVPTTWPGAGG